MGHLRGKALNLPLGKLLGGARDRVPTYASGALMRGLSLDRVVTAAGRLKEKGFREMKTQLALPGETTPAKEVERMQRVREAIGPDIKLMCDPPMTAMTKTSDTNTSITAAVFSAFLKCPTKAHLMAIGESAPGAFFADIERRISAMYKTEAKRRPPIGPQVVKFLDFRQQWQSRRYENISHHV